MRHGDLSNQLAPGIGIRFENIIKTHDGKLNRQAKNYLQSMGLKIDANIYIITSGDRRKALAFLVKWSVPYTNVIEAESDLEIPDIVRENDLVQYIDTDKRILENINARGEGKVEVRLWTQDNA